ncbi:MAG: hypothetical protein HC886_07605 [Leptolyngbyaceae cyanobacterium SM1_1_3]|nr:hypothetical protein [Leptolyngbyaceae cyanobacterium SM1_1_3]NJN02222.1 hypothetical protein [Leptolyngbyaceae cyanobacterium RM1_1_2]NJO09802.1 hypothetical protein [Leptolyngbyaceae cyanobacterium SL_1_1]
MTKPKIPQDGDSASPSAITVDAGTLAFVIFLALLLPLIISGFLFQ